MIINLFNEYDEVHHQILTFHKQISKILKRLKDKFKINELESKREELKQDILQYIYTADSEYVEKYDKTAKPDYIILDELDDIEVVHLIFYKKDCIEIISNYENTFEEDKKVNSYKTIIKRGDLKC